MNAESILQWPVEGSRVAYIANAHVENCFVLALQNYLAFAKNHLLLSLPLRVEAGITGIKGYPISLNASQIGGKSLHDVVLWEGELDSYEKPAWEILAPFFDRMWSNCGYQRTAQKHAELVSRFSVRR